MGAASRGAAEIDVSQRAATAPRQGEAVAARRAEATTTAAAAGAALVVRFRCGACHADLPQPLDRPRLRAADAASIHAALRGDTHPDLQLSEGEAFAIARGVSADGARLRGELRRIQRQQPGATPESGRRLAAAVNCGGCHEGLPATAGVAPVLTGLVDGTREDWLRAYLRAPHALRPSGVRPGSGARMPDFHLSDAQADSIARYLRQRVPRAVAGAAPARVTVHAAATADVLLDRLSCRGCHRYRGRGGRIGPALDDVHERRTPAYIAAIIRDPAATRAGAAMPRSDDTRVERVIALLAGGDPRTDTGTAARDGGAVPERSYLAALDHSLADTVPADETQRLYAFWCAACHGAAGRGDGHNAQYLGARPAVHADADAMSLRPDDTLFDGIAAGGAALGRSPEMPAFGSVLSAAQMRALVGHIRRLCACSGPAWSVRRAP